MSTPAPMPALMTVTEAAAERVRAMLAKRSPTPAGLRIGVKAKGCAGLSYLVDYADAANPTDEVVSAHGVTLFIDNEATLFLAGTEMDYVAGQLQSGFVFRNPNEKSRCGCGESFTV